MTEISSTNNSKIISDSYDDIYDNEHSITTTGTNGTTSQAIRNFLNATDIIPTDKQTTDIKQRKQNTIDDKQAEIIAQEIIDFCISDDDGTADTDRLIACMNYICANLDDASINVFLSTLGNALRELNYMLKM